MLAIRCWLWDELTACGWAWEGLAFVISDEEGSSGLMLRNTLLATGWGDGLWVGVGWVVRAAWATEVGLGGAGVLVAVHD